MTERKTVPFIEPNDNERENGERLFSSNPELLRTENTRLQQALTHALEERNRLLKNRSLPGGPGKSAGLRVLEERLENTRGELAQLKQEQAAREEKIQILQERLTATGRIPGRYIAKLEDALVSSGGDSEAAGSPVENAADAPDRVSERFDAAVDGLWQIVKQKRHMQNTELHRQIEKLEESLDFTKNESSRFHTERDSLGDQVEDLQNALQRSESEMALRYEKLLDFEGRFEEQEEANKKQAATILKLKKQLSHLRGSVDAELYAHVTGGSGAPMDATGGWKELLLSRAAFTGLLLGMTLALGGWWLTREFTPVVILPPKDDALAHPVAEAQTASTAIDSAATAKKTGSPSVNEVHRDALRSGGKGPALIKLPGDSFTMGTDRYAAPEIENPARQEQVKDFYISRFEVSFDQYDAFARASGLELPPDQGWGRGSRPVINVSWHSARAYTDWLSRQTGQRYRLPSEAEWEYAIGGGSDEIYWWGNDFEQGREVCFNCGTEWDGRSTAPAGSTQPNRFGLYDMGGNAMEWVEDCLAVDAASGDCTTRVVRGGAFNRPNDTLRITARRGLEAKSRHSTVGFRVVREAKK